jgi:hypothetical protein
MLHSGRLQHCSQILQKAGEGCQGQTLQIIARIKFFLKLIPACLCPPTLPPPAGCHFRFRFERTFRSSTVRAPSPNVTPASPPSPRNLCSGSYPGRGPDPEGSATEMYLVFRRSSVRMKHIRCRCHKFDVLFIDCPTK